MPDNRQNDPETIERDIERTQEEMSDTVDELEEKLTPRNIGESLLGEDRSDMLREGWQLVRENPIPSAMIAVGAVWLLASSTDSPLVRRGAERVTNLIGGRANKLRPRSEEPAPIGPPPPTGDTFDRRA